jgi:hypothetical protein
MVSTRRNDYDPPSVQNQGDGRQRNNPPHDAGSSQAFNLEVEFRKLQGLEGAHAVEISIFREERELRLKGKEKVMDEDPNRLGAQ